MIKSDLDITDMKSWTLTCTSVESQTFLSFMGLKTFRLNKVDMVQNCQSVSSIYECGKVHRTAAMGHISTREN